MATSDDALETYTHIPVYIDAQSKQVSVTSSDQSLRQAIESVNVLHSAFKNIDTQPNIPPPPIPINPKRTAQINKLRESGSNSVRKGQLNDAIRMFGIAIDMAASRPPWEPIALVKEELAACYMARANTHLLAQNWVEGWKDAEMSTECKRGPQTGPNGEKLPSNTRAFVIGGRCLVEMGKWQEAYTWLKRAVELEGTEGDEGRELQRLFRVAKEHIGEE